MKRSKTKKICPFLMMAGPDWRCEYSPHRSRAQSQHVRVLNVTDDQEPSGRATLHFHQSWLQDGAAIHDG